MQKLEIQAFSLEEAKLKAYEQGVTVAFDVTKYWSLNGQPIFERELKSLVADYMLEKGLFDFKDAGVILAIIPGIKDNRDKPFNIKFLDRGTKLKAKKYVEVYRTDTNVMIGEALTKPDALEIAKEFVKENKISVYARQVYKTPKNLIFTMDYKPSKNAKLGQYFVFYTDEADVKLSKKRSKGLL